MIEKTPYEIMREKQKTIIEAQKKAAEERSILFIKNLETITLQQKIEKIEAQNKETLRKAEEQRIIKEKSLEEERIKQQNKRQQQSINNTLIQLSDMDDVPLSFVASTDFSKSSNDSCSSTSNSYDSYDSGSSSDSSSSSCSSSDY